MALNTLIIDDDESLAKGLKAALELEGLKVTQTINSNEAREAFNKRIYDAVVVDTGFEGRAAGDLLIELREKSPETTIIATLSMYTDLEEQQAKLLGARHLLKKPFEPDFLVQTIKNSVEEECLYRKNCEQMDKPNLLLVEDDVSLSKALQMTFSIEGYDTKAVNSVIEALEELKKQYYHIVVTDLKLNGLNGTDLIAAIRRIDPGIVIIVITGYANIDSVLTAIRHHVYQYLRKPVEPDDLITAVNRAWEKQKLKWLSEKQKKELEKANKEIKETANQLIQAEKLSVLGELSAGVAHELNQPLNVIKIIGQTLLLDANQDRYEKDQFCEDIKDIVNQVDKMAEIIDHMRLFTRRSEGTSLSFIININDIIKEVFKFLDQQLKVNNITIIKELSPDLPKVNGDPIRIEQVLINIINNARHAVEESSKESKQIVIRTNKLKSEDSILKKESIVIEVQDNGMGIPENVKDNIFKSFFTTKKPGKGTGLGLSVVNRIIEEHKGKIEVNSKEKEGTTFKITLPTDLETT